MLAIRLQRTGSAKRPYYRVVLMEARSARDSRFIENLGTYYPRSRPATVEIDKARVEHWLRQGARPSDTVRTLLQRHLTRDRGAVVEAPAAAE
ncbi:MAG: 30S ribosomal protein S16 [Acidimicrobiia bacterium]|nr:30S ribosomal protein S16 [Acidimicrobiia bacterium]